MSGRQSTLAEQLRELRIELKEIRESLSGLESGLTKRLENLEKRTAKLWQSLFQKQEAVNPAILTDIGGVRRSHPYRYN